MKIILSDKYFIRDDYGASVVLIEIKEYTSQKEETKGQIILAESAIGYFADVPSAVKRYITMLATDRTSEKATLREYIENYKEAVKQLERLLRGQTE